MACRRKAPRYGNSHQDATCSLRPPLARPAAGAVEGGDPLRALACGYYDYGQVWSQAGIRTQSAAIAAAGLAISKGAFTGSVELAQPLIHPDVDGSKSARVFFEIAAHF